MSFQFILPVPRGRCSKMIFLVFLSYDICIVLLFALLRRLLTVKSQLNVIHDKIFYYIYHVVPGNSKV